MQDSLGGIPTITPPTPVPDGGDVAQAIEPAVVAAPAEVVEPAVAESEDETQAGPSGSNGGSNGGSDGEVEEDIQLPADLGDWSVAFEAVSLKPRTCM